MTQGSLLVFPQIILGIPILWESSSFLGSEKEVSIGRINVDEDSSEPPNLSRKEHKPSWQEQFYWAPGA